MKVDWYEGEECEWLRRSGERTHALASVDTHFAHASLVLVRVSAHGSTMSVVSTSPTVTYTYPRDSMVRTVFGLWPSPLEQIAAVARGEVSGLSKGRLLYAAYWNALAHSKPLRLWIAEQYPTYWEILVSSFDALKDE